MTHTVRENSGERRAVELRVSGMSCQACEQALSLILRQHPAVESAEADAESGTVRIELNSDVDLAELKQRIHSAGYETE